MPLRLARAAPARARGAGSHHRAFGRHRVCRTRRLLAPRSRAATFSCHARTIESLVIRGSGFGLAATRGSHSSPGSQSGLRRTRGRVRIQAPTDCSWTRRLRYPHFRFDASTEIERHASLAADVPATHTAHRRRAVTAAASTRGQETLHAPAHRFICTLPAHAAPGVRAAPARAAAPAHPSHPALHRSAGPVPHTVARFSRGPNAPTVFANA
jgi:hypothetical protein